MHVERDKVVALELSITDLAGETVLRSEPDRPMVYLHGHGTLAPGLERALEGSHAGHEVELTLSPAEAFGELDPSKIQYLDRSQFPGDAELEVGQQFGAENEQGESVVLWVTAVEGDRITVNANHPLAGYSLCFRARVVAIREPSEEERLAGRPLEPPPPEGGAAPSA